MVSPWMTLLSVMAPLSCRGYGPPHAAHGPECVVCVRRGHDRPSCARGRVRACRSMATSARVAMTPRLRLLALVVGRFAFEDGETGVVVGGLGQVRERALAGHDHIVAADVGFGVPRARLPSDRRAGRAWTPAGPSGPAGVSCPVIASAHLLALQLR